MQIIADGDEGWSAGDLSSAHAFVLGIKRQERLPQHNTRSFIQRDELAQCISWLFGFPTSF